MKNIITQYNGMVVAPEDVSIIMSPDSKPEVSFYGSINSVSDNYIATFSEPTYDDIFNKLIARLSKAPIVEHKCHNCGGTVELDEDKHIFHCPYCNSVYAIGTNQIYS